VSRDGASARPGFGSGSTDGVLAIDPETDAAVRAHASADYPREACGLLLGWRGAAGVRVVRAVPRTNAADPSRRDRRFRIDPSELGGWSWPLRDDRAALVGFYHSHPDAPAVPSVADTDYMRLWPRTVWLIVPVHRARVADPRAWRLDGPHHDRPAEVSVLVDQPLRTRE
jgi:proteasome lid subunit RPN8/RPN11